MKRKAKIAVMVVMLLVAVSIPVSTIAQEKEPMKRGIGPANLYLSMKDKIGITKEQEDRLINVEKEAMRRLEEVTTAVTKAQQSLNNLTREEDMDLVKIKELLKNIASLEAEGRYIVIETIALENKVITKDQREKAKEIVKDMSKRPQAPSGSPANK